eukprot:c19277_g1_i1 orf=45-611(+)
MAMVVLESASAASLSHGSTSSTIAQVFHPSPRSCSRVAVPKFRGLKRIANAERSSSFSCASTTHRRAYQGIVCEQQKEALAAPGVVTDQTWKEVVLESDIPVLVDFWAPWCGPCRMIAPLVDEIAVQFAGKVKCLKLNTDESPNTATEYGVRSIPTVMIFKKGVKRETIIGAVPKAALVTAVEKFLDR